LRIVDKPKKEESKEGEDQSHVLVVFEAQGMGLDDEIRGHEHHHSRNPNPVGRPKGILNFKIRGQNTRQRMVKVAQVLKKESCPVQLARRGGLVQSSRYAQEEEDKEKTEKGDQDEKIGEHFFPVVGKEIAEENYEDPGDRHQWPGLRGVTGALGQEGGAEDIGCGDEDKQDEIAPFGLHHDQHSESREEVDGGVEQESISLIEEISGQGFPSETEGNAVDELFQVGYRFLGCHSTSPGNRRK
jgi:hypothetical protein